MKCSNCGNECSSRDILPGDTKCINCGMEDRLKEEKKEYKPATDIKNQKSPTFITVLYVLPFIWVVLFFVVSYLTQFNKGPWLWRFFKRGIFKGETDITSFTVGLKNLIGLPPSLTWFIDITNPTPFLVFILLIVFAIVVDKNFNNIKNQVMRSYENRKEFIKNKE